MNSCSKRRLCEREDCQECFQRSFASHEKVQFWSKKNKDINPRQVFKGCKQKIWFDCYQCHHAFLMSLNIIFTHNAWCPYCSNHALCEQNECKICFQKSFASHEKATFWSKKNIKTPRQIFTQSNKKFWFDCGTCGHEFDSVLSNIYQGKWCAYCNNKKLCDNDECQHCYDKSFASHEKAQFWSKKNGDNNIPRQVFKGSNQKYWFDCETCGHEFETVLSCITLQNTWCPFCVNLKLCYRNSCEICFNKSFASHDYSDYWSEKNGDIKPRHVIKGSEKKFEFVCGECRHAFHMSLDKITQRNQWCPYCGHNQLCNQDNCTFCFDASFASHNKSKYWSVKNDNIKPRQVFKRCDGKYWFDCHQCGHEFESTLGNIVRLDVWCPYCCNPPKKLCEDNECQQCYDKSFASHEKSQFWSEKNSDIQPRHVIKGSGNKYWFDCYICQHSFDVVLSSITSQNTWCPKCVNKTELKLFNHLQSVFSDLETQFRTDWCKNHLTERCLPFDFVLHESKIIIELDGRQHFVQVRNWRDPESQFEIDQYKQQCANEHGYSVVRLLQEDVWYDRYDWYSELISAIRELEHNESIRNIYLCKNQEYEKFII